MDAEIANLVDWGDGGAPDPAPEPKPQVPETSAELVRLQLEAQRHDREREKRAAEDAEDELKVVLPAMQRWMSAREAKTHYKWILPAGGAALGAMGGPARRAENAILGAVLGFAVGWVADESSLRADRRAPDDMPVEVRAELALRHPGMPAERQLRWPMIWRKLARGSLGLLW
jgi:hypothetical protein